MIQMWVNVRAIILREVEGEKEVLIQKRVKQNEEQMYEFPGGRLEEFESIVQGLKREVLEETGLEVFSVMGTNNYFCKTTGNKTVEFAQPIGVYQTIEGNVDSMGMFFVCQAKGNLLREGDNTTDIKWVNIAILKAMLEDNQFTPVANVGVHYYIYHFNKECALN